MAYDSEFFEAYDRYLHEDVVRENHGDMFALFDRLCVATNKQVVDLGCGIGEYFRWGRFFSYVGIDKSNHGHPGTVIEGDYLDATTLQRLPFVPTAFVSLFSIEPMLPAADRYALYRRLFADNPQLKCGLVSGFFYATRAHLEVVGETGGIKSYQTLEHIDEFKIPGVHEERFVINTPSAMFGPDVMEVWKIFVRP